MKKLGFGLMRLPLINDEFSRVDKKMLCDMVDYYLDKTSLKVLNYNPPYYTIKVNEYSTDTSKPMDRQMNTWEFKYDINSNSDQKVL